MAPLGENRTVNSVPIESYLRGVVPRESPASWGLAGGGAGANALRAQSVAARSYALTQDRYSYAQTCDSSACQVYGGAGWRVAASSTGATSREHELTDAAIVATAGKVRLWPCDGPDRVDRVLGVQRPAHRGRFVPGRRRSGRRGAGQSAASLDPRHRRPGARDEVRPRHLDRRLGRA